MHIYTQAIAQENEHTHAQQHTPLEYELSYINFKSVVYLFSALTAQVTKLCEAPPDDRICSVAFHEKVCIHKDKKTKILHTIQAHPYTLISTHLHKKHY